MSTHVLKNTQVTLSIEFSAGAADGTVTTTITDAAGATVSTGTATHGTGGNYTYALTPQTEVASLTVKWAGTWVGVAQSLEFPAEIVGAELFSLAELRVFADAALTDTTKYPDKLLQSARARITDFFEQICGVSFIPRYHRYVFDGNGRPTLWLPKKRFRKLLAVTVNGTAYTGPQLAALYTYPTGEIYNISGWPAGTPRNITVAYEHGHQAPPGEITKAALTLARYELVSNELSDRTISLTDDLGTIRLSVPGPNFPTGLPVVDSALGRYTEGVLVEVVA